MCQALRLLLLAAGLLGLGSVAAPRPASAEPGDSPEAQVRARSEAFHRAFNAHDLERTLAFCDRTTFVFRVDADFFDYDRARRALNLRFIDFPNLRFVPGETKVTAADETISVDIHGGIATEPPDSTAKEEERLEIQVSESWRKMGDAWLLVGLKLTIPE